MTDTVYRELDLPCSPSEAWEHVIDPSWLGEDGDLPTTPGSDGWISDGGDVRYLIVEEVDEDSRLAYRWRASPTNHREWKSNSRQSLKERASRSRSHRSR